MSVLKKVCSDDLRELPHAEEYKPLDEEVAESRRYKPFLIWLHQEKKR